MPVAGSLVSQVIRAALLVTLPEATFEIIGGAQSIVAVAWRVTLNPPWPSLASMYVAVIVAPFATEITPS
jgi:hypothetical protein